MHNRVVIYGGAFSPPHLGHASIIQTIIKSFPCDEIWIMPSADRHDKKVSASADHRVKMLEIMISELFSNPPIPVKISAIEIERNKLTTTYDTMKELEEKHQNSEFYFILGPDIVGDISKWIDGDKLLNETKTKFIIFNIGEDIEPPDDIKSRCIIINHEYSKISSTLIRNLIAQGESDLPQTTKGIAEYIRNNNLYK